MDSLTHLAAGALSPLIFARAPRAASLVIFGVIAGELPDIDILAGNSAQSAFAVHRVMTHSIPAVLLFALLLTLIFKFYLSRLRVRQETVRVEAGAAVINRPDDWSAAQIFAAALIGLGLHIYLDCMTTFGTEIFWPFSAYRVALPALFIVDPLFTLPLLCIMFYCLKTLNNKDKFAQHLRWARRGLAWTLLYPLLCLGIHSALTYKYNRDYAEVGTAVEKITLAPVLFSPLYWKAVAENEREYRMSWVATYKFMHRVNFNAPPYPKADPAIWAKLPSVDRIFAGYQNFVSFPTFEISRQNEEMKEYTFKDLRYLYQIPNFIPLGIDQRQGIFNMQIRVGTRNNKAYAWRYLERGVEDGSMWNAVRPAVALE